jgi:glutathione S-transferase
MLIYHDWNASPNCLKTKILLNELGIPYEQRNLDKAALQGQEYRAKFPTGQAPAIEDGEVRICESGAIALYLAEKSNALIPKDRGRRALMYQALFIEGTLLAPTVGGQGLFGELFKPEAERNRARVAELRIKAQRVAEVLGEVLGSRTYFAEEFSLADIQLYAATSKSLEGGAFENPPKNLVAWCARMGERASVMKAREEYVHYRKPAGEKERTAPALAQSA